MTAVCTGVALAALVLFFRERSLRMRWEQQALAERDARHLAEEREYKAMMMLCDEMTRGES